MSERRVRVREKSACVRKRVKKRQERNRRLFFYTREKAPRCHTFHTRKRNTQHTYQRERERLRERSKEEGKEALVVLARVVGYESENEFRKFFLFFFARQRGESKLERDSEMVRR